MELKYKFINLCNWIVENGGFVNDNLSIDYSEKGGKFIKSNGVISKDDDLFLLPDNLLLNKINVGLDINSGSEKNDTVISLLYELKKEESFWDSYLNILPEITDFKEHPLFLYKNSNIKNISNFTNYELSSLYNEYLIVNKYLKDINLFDVVFDDELFWAFLVVTTRMWGNSGLVPIADLFQHSYDSNITLFKKDTFSSMKSDRNFNNNDIIYDNYLVKSDVSLFFNFGFLQETNHVYSNIIVDYNECNKDEKDFIKSKFEIFENKKDFLKKEFEFDEHDHILIIINNFNDQVSEKDFDELKKWSILKQWIIDSKDFYQNDVGKDHFNYKVDKLVDRIKKLHDNCIKNIDNKILELSK